MAMTTTIAFTTVHCGPKNVLVTTLTQKHNNVSPWASAC